MRMQTATRGDTKHTLLFDAGPEASAWRRNATRTRADISQIEHIHLSHWHRDHSGGLPEAVRMINAAAAAAASASASAGRPPDGSSPRVTVDVHPDRPDYRGLATPSGAVVSLEADPTLDEIAGAGAAVARSAGPRTLLGGFFLASGFIPRRTAYELGVRGGLRFSGAAGAWAPDEAIADERLVVCRLGGKGLVVFTGCSHAGVINACRHAVELVGEGEGEGEGGDGGSQAPVLYGVVGGFHLSDNDPEKLERSLADLKALKPQVLMPGHCTGWRFKAMCEAAMPGVVVPSFCGTTYTMAS